MIIAYIFNLLVTKLQLRYIIGIRNLLSSFNPHRHSTAGAVERVKIATEYSKIIRHIKRSFIYGLDEETKAQAKAEISHAKYYRGHSGIWQERFYEHTIRDEKDWLEKMEYIKHNPIKHEYVENLTDWEYTSFK